MLGGVVLLVSVAGRTSGVRPWGLVCAMLSMDCQERGVVRKDLKLSREVVEDQQELGETTRCYLVTKVLLSQKLLHVR